MFLDNLPSAKDRPQEFLKIAATLRDGNKTIAEIENALSQSFVARCASNIEWGSLTVEESTRSFADLLSLTFSLCGYDEESSSQLLTVVFKSTGYIPVRMLIVRDAEATSQPLLRLCLVKHLLSASLSMWKKDKSVVEWLKLCELLLSHLKTRASMVDSVVITERALVVSSKKRSCIGEYRRCEVQLNSRHFVTFSCLETGAQLHLSLYPSGSFGLIEACRENDCSTRVTFDHSAAVHFKKSQGRTFADLTRGRRSFNETEQHVVTAPFPDFDPRTDEEPWSAWSDDKDLDIFEHAVSEMLPGFEYYPRTEKDCCDPDFVKYQQLLLNELFENEFDAKRRRLG